MKGFWAILIKEFNHLKRERSTLFFVLLIPAIQLTIFGYAAHTTIKNIPMVILDLDHRQDSRHLIEAFVNTQTFQIAINASSYDEFNAAFKSGEAKAGLIIPPDYSERLLRNEQAHLQLQVDGSDSQVATAAMNTASLLAQNVSLQYTRRIGGTVQVSPSRDLYGHSVQPIELRPRVLYNPDLVDSHFFVPALVAVILQFVLSFLTAFSIAREREHGTLEQLFVTPVSPSGVLLGKLTPYAVLSLTELVVVLVVMNTLFEVPINGRLVTLFCLCGLFILTALGLGLMISTLATTQLQAMQFTFLIMMPSVLLSGFVFPRAEMAWPLYAISSILPATYFVDILRGVIVRGADFMNVLPSIAGLAACAVVIAFLSVIRFRKCID